MKVMELWLDDVSEPGCPQWIVSVEELDPSTRESKSSTTTDFWYDDGFLKALERACALSKFKGLPLYHRSEHGTLQCIYSPYTILVTDVSDHQILYKLHGDRITMLESSGYPDVLNLRGVYLNDSMEPDEIRKKVYDVFEEYLGDSELAGLSVATLEYNL